MRIENQIITLPQAKRLLELGVVNSSYFVLNSKGEAFESWGLEGYEDDLFPAFTVTEMGRMIGSGTFASQKFHDAVSFEMNRSHSMTIATAPQFVGNFLIAAIEQYILKVDEANKRLTHE